MPVFGDLDPGEEYLYHYTSAEKLALILMNGSLRLGPYSGTRDPLENKTWYPNLTSPPDFDMLNIDAVAIWEGLDAAIRQRAKLACFTMDDKTADRWENTRRGWGRARMWEQYADRHHGAVLIFDQSKLTNLIETALAGRPLLHGPVVYQAGPWSVSMIRGIDLVEIQQRGVKAVADDLIRQAGSEFFFQKDIDWASEAEYRYLAVSDSEAEFVGVSDALVAVALGQDYPEYEKVVLVRRLAQASAQHAVVSQVYWRNGYPVVMPVLLSEA